MKAFSPIFEKKQFRFREFNSNFEIIEFGMTKSQIGSSKVLLPNYKRILVPPKSTLFYKTMNYLYTL